MTNWIYCDDRLPEDERNVLVCYRNLIPPTSTSSHIGIASYFIGDWSNTFEDELHPYAWAELPEPAPLREKK